MKKRMRPLDLTLTALFTALMAVGANIAQFLVIGGVPITLQTFFSIMAGALLGSRLGALSMIVYTFVGLAGAPVFAQFTGGPAILIQPTFGFALSFIVVSYVTGKIIEASKNPSLSRFMIACMVGLLVNYVIGTNYMYYAYKFWLDAPAGFTYQMVLLWMAAPFVKDILLTVFTAVTAPRIYKAIHQSSKYAKRHVTG